MKRFLPTFATLAAAVSAFARVAPLDVPGRHIRLSGDDGDPPGVVRFLSQRVELSEGQKTSWVTLTRVGQFWDPRYGDFEITPSHLQQMVANFEKRTLGQDVFLDVAHRPSNGAAAKVLRLSIENGRLRGLVEWTEFGLDAVKKRGFVYLSAEYDENWQDNEHKQRHGCVLLGAGLTTRPVVKHLDPVDVKHLSLDAPPDGIRCAISDQLINELSQKELDMNWLEQLKAKYESMGIKGDAMTKLLAEAKTAFDAAGNDQAKALAVLTQWEAIGKTVADQVKTLAAAGNTQPVVIQVAAPGGSVADEVARLLAERDTQAQAAQTALAAKRKLLADTIAAGDKTLTPEGVQKLCADVDMMITAVTTDEQIKALAELQLGYVKKLSAAERLVSLGYNAPSGSVHITVDESNGIKALQEHVDRRVGIVRLSDAERYQKTGGQLPAKNKAFADEALEAFDRANGARLLAEHRALAGGTGSVSDVAVPAAVERTVLRESLYRLTSMAFMDVGTYPFSQVVTIPYSYRDTAAAGVEALRMYEGQGIRNAGVIQTTEETRPVPQKLAYKLSEELRLLMSASVINWDPVAENVRNVIRIVGEDTEALNMNELVFSADEFGCLDFTDTLTAQVNGTNKVFVTTKFPVVRPRKFFDLKGVQAGSTMNPLTVTLGGTVIQPYALPADGSALAAGTYYVADWNLGEFRFVDEDGAIIAPANATTLTIAGKYATNAVKFDVDAVGGEDLKDRFDRLLTQVGYRKAVIQSDRYYTANMLLMSANVDNMVSQARSFEANASRVATGLGPDGSVGQVKGIPAFNNSAPGLVMADTRILIGERGNSRFRMLKPWSMNPLEQSRDANGNFTAQQQSFGTQWVAVHTPTQLKNSLTSIVLYSTTGRVARAA